MPKVLKIPERSADNIINIAQDTLNMGKQAIVFVNSKASAESQAEKISISIKRSDEGLQNLSAEILAAVSSPTRQCKRLALCAKKGVVFHHAGLTSKQREIIEDNFRKGMIRVICATPTLAMGVDLPAFRVIIRDLKRYGGPWGMSDIPVLEYEQQAGRAGRPGMEDYGEAICIAKTESELDKIFEKYISGDHENIYSKLAVEPVLRTHVLSLIANDFIHDRESMFGFFDRTFYAHQYIDLEKLHSVLEKITGLLEEWEFIKTSGEGGDFVSADEIGGENFEITPLGKRVSELYLDPLTASFIITSLRRSTSVQLTNFSLLHMLSSTLELRPLLRVKVSEYEDIQGKLLPHASNLIVLEPSQFDEAYDDFLNSVKTALFFQDWIDEKDEEWLLETYNIRPGEINAKIEIADWLLYSSYELAKMMRFQELLKYISRLRIQLKYGVKEELIPLLKLKNIGRVRARKMYGNKLKSLTDLKNIDIVTLSQLIGKATAISVKKQLGQEFDPTKIVVRENKRKGQISLKDYTSGKKKVKKEN